MEAGTPTSVGATGARAGLAAVRVDASSFTVADVRAAVLRLNWAQVGPGMAMSVLALWFVLASMHVAAGARLAASVALLLLFAWKVLVQLPRRQVASLPPGTWTICADGVRIQQPGHEALLGWESFARVRRTPGHLMLHQEGRAVLFIPLRRLPAGCADRVGAHAATAGVPTQGFTAAGP